MTEPFQSISELSKNLDVPAHTLRFWEKTFPSAIKPVTGAGGRRYYRADTAIILTRIRQLLYDNGYTLAGVKKLIAAGQLMESNDVPVKTSKKTAARAPESKPIKSDKTESMLNNLYSPNTYANATLEIEPEIDRVIGLLMLAKKTLN